MTSQKYEIRNELASGDKVALEIDWTGTLAVPFQTISTGGQMRAYFAAFLEFKDGKIVPQRNYDCYEPQSASCARRNNSFEGTSAILSGPALS